MPQPLVYGPGSALLLTRATPLPEVAEAFDAWQFATHLPDLMRAPGAREVAYGVSEPARRPAALAGTAERLALYASDSASDMMTFVGSDVVAEAIADGSRWFGQFRDLDSEPYSGNVYVVDRAWGDGLQSAAFLLVERLEIPDPLIDEFDAWVVECHLPALRDCGATSGVRVCSAQRSGIPVPYYYSRGNRAVLVAIELGDRHEDLTLAEDLRAALAASREWDLRIPYAEREVFEIRHRLQAAGPAGTPQEGE